MEHGVEHRPGDNSAVSGIRQAIGTRQQHPATGGAHDEHVADVTAGRRSQLEVAQQLKRSGPNHVAACLVPRKGGFIDQGDLRPTPGEHKGGDAARRSAPYDEHVKAGHAHAAPFECGIYSDIFPPWRNAC